MTGPIIPAEIPDSVTDAVAEALGEALDCTRVWEAWSYGTMGPDDFSTVAEDGGRVAEIALAAIRAWEASKPQPAPAIDLEQFRLHLKRSILLVKHHTKATDQEIREEVAEAGRLLALIDGQVGDNSVRVDRGALQMALNVLRRAGKCEVADALAGGVTEQPAKGEGE